MEWKWGERINSGCWQKFFPTWHIISVDKKWRFLYVAQPKRASQRQNYDNLHVSRNSVKFAKRVGDVIGVLQYPGQSASGIYLWRSHCQQEIECRHCLFTQVDLEENTKTVAWAVMGSFVWLRSCSRIPPRLWLSCETTHNVYETSYRIPWSCSLRLQPELASRLQGLWFESAYELKLHFTLTKGGSWKWISELIRWLCKE